MAPGPGPTSVAQSVFAERIPAVRQVVRALPPAAFSVRRLLNLDCEAATGPETLVRLIESWGLSPDLRIEALGDAEGTQRRLLATCARAALEPALDQLTSAFPWDDYWRHNLAVAWAADSLAAPMQVPGTRTMAFAAGLLHDVGKWALLVCFPRAYARVLQRVRERGACICAAEHELFGCDHAWAGRELGQQWDLPTPVTEASWLHHQDPTQLPPQVEHADLVRLIHVADHLARRAGIGFSGFGHTETMAELERLAGVDGRTLKQVQTQLPARVEQTAGSANERESTRAGQPGRTTRPGTALPTTEEAGADQRLQLAASCATALARSGELERTGCTLEEACRTAASLICEVLPARATLVALATEGAKYLHLGAQSNVRNRLPERVVSLRSGRLACAWSNLSGAEPASGWQEAPEAGETLWRLGVLPEAESNLKRLGLRYQGRVVGVVLADVTPEVSQAWHAAPEFARALADVFALTLGGIQARVEAEHAGEQLLGQQRRMRGHEHERLQRQSQLSITEVAGGAAHEMNNPLAVISGRAQMLLSTCTDEAQARGLRIIVAQTQRASEIALDLMGFAKPAAPRPALQPLESLLSAVCQHWQAPAARKSVRIILETVPSDATVFADPGQLRAVLDALLANALEASHPENARVQINSTFDPADDTVRIVVEDNGVGMEREVLEHALDPLFSSRPAGRGRGLGLSRAYCLVEINGGRLRLESKPKIGTSVTLELPARPPQA